MFNGGPVLLHEFANPALGSLPARWRGLTWCLRHPPSWTRALTRRGSQPTHRVFPNVAALVSTDSPVSRPPAHKPPSGPNWIHEIKHDVFRLMARRDPVGIRLITRRGNDWTNRYPFVVEAVNHLKVRSCLIDCEVVCCDEGE